jgi:hypothetical protein
MTDYGRMTGISKMTCAGKQTVYAFVPDPGHPSR